MIGRVLRPAEGKANAVVLDHSGATFRHGFVEDRSNGRSIPIGGRPVRSTPRLAKGSSSRLLECKQCGSVRIAGEPCQHCGYFPKRPGDAVTFRDGDLSLFSRRAARDSFVPLNTTDWHAMLAYIGQQRGYKPGWAAYAGRRGGMSHHHSPIQEQSKSIATQFATQLSGTSVD
jgi:DNA repair protein RadD